MHFPTAFVTAAVVSILTGSAAVAAPLAQQSTSEQNGARKEDVYLGVAGGALAGGGIAGLIGIHHLNKQQKTFDVLERFLEDQRNYHIFDGEKKKATIKEMEDVISSGFFQQQAEQQKEVQRARMGQILRANGPQWICMYNFLQARGAIVRGYTTVSAWNEAANDCDEGNHLPVLRVTVGSGEASFQLPEKLWLPQEKKWSSSQFALQPAHNAGLLQSFAHQAQRSLHTFTRTPAFAASMLQKAENFGKKTVGEMERVEAF
ncbi:MAG: hypothetical protein M1826_006353 [Phylliscum demangeonii]|nr:MAG: hypothetical protein M1826_006353 [Phylliscum demangeonii]